MDAITLSRVGGILGPFALIFGLVMNAIYNILDGIPVGTLFVSKNFCD